MGSTPVKPPKPCVDCGHCNIGILYDEQYIMCKHCNMKLCDDCHSLHPDNHLRKSAIALRSLQSFSNVPPRKKRCFDCLKSAHCLVSCDECPRNWCEDCVEDNVESFDKHEHREMTSVELPGFAILAESERDSTCKLCVSSSTFLHCGSCRQGQGEGIMMLCKTCWVDYGSSQAMCRNCFNTCSKHHDRSHQFISYLYEIRTDVSDGYFSIRCRECEESFTHLNQKIVKDHPHRQYIISVSCEMSEEFGYKQWRLCPRRGVQPDGAADAMQIKTIRKCQRCLQVLAFGKQNAFCSTCYHHFCEHCIISGQLNHRHGALTICTWVERRAPDNFLSSGKLRCDLCTKEVYRDYDSYMRCQECFSYSICNDCYSGSKQFQHAHGAEMTATFLHVQPPADQAFGTDWLNEALLNTEI